MTRSLRTLILTAITTAALCVAGVSAAQAVEFHSLLAETEITSRADGNEAQSHHVIDLAGGTLTCGAVSFTGTMPAKTITELTLKPVYEKCTYLGKTATVNMNFCDYLLKANGEFSITGEKCSIAKMRIEVTGCEVVIGPQNFGKGEEEPPSTYTEVEVEAPKELTWSLKLKKISYTATGGGCLETGAFNNGEYTTGNTILRGYEKGTGKQTSIWVA